MAENLVTPDVEALIVEDFATNLAPYPVATAVPDPRPAAFIRILRTGGEGRTQRVLERVNITVEAWADDEVTAHNIAADCEARLFELADLPGEFYSVEPFSSPARLPDPVSAQHRYTATYQVTVRAVAS